MPLTDTAARKAKPQKGKPYKLADGEGMFLLVHPNGSKYWRLKYRFAGKEKLLALGVYPQMTLGEAREKRLKARKLLEGGIDPGDQKRQEKRLQAFTAENTFQAITREWYDTNKHKWTPRYQTYVWRRLEMHLFPHIGQRPVTEIASLELLDVLRRIEKRGNTELSHRMLQTCNLIFRYAVVTARTKYNPATDLQGALKAHKTTNHPTIAASELPDFFKALEIVDTSPQNKIAVRLLMLTFVRQGEMRRAKWNDIDFQAKEWRLPAENTKMRERHIVPLSRQTLRVLKELMAITGEGILLFPSQQRRRHAIMSENTVNHVLKRMGYGGKLVGHGFRALASTILNEHGFRTDVIERQLAHAERNKVRAAYNRAEYLKERGQMMQWWGDYIDAAAAGDKVVRNKLAKSA